MASSFTSISIFSHTNFLLRMMYILEGSGMTSDLNLTSMQFRLSILITELWNLPSDMTPVLVEFKDRENNFVSPIELTPAY